MKTHFINEALDLAINNYLSSKDKPESILYNSFLVVVIRMLVRIYGELDIVNPYQMKSESFFDTNLMKFGASKEDIDKLKKLIMEYYVIDKSKDKNKDNPYFIIIQKRLIDLFNLKRLNFGIEESESKEFFDLLYTPGTSNALRLSYNYLCAENIYEVAEYYKQVMNEKKEVLEDKKDILGFDIYKLFNVSISDISKMNASEVTKLNTEIYKALDISPNAINKDFLLKSKIDEIKRLNNPITTGNGYVDILLIMSIIVTVVMVVLIFTTILI